MHPSSTSIEEEPEKRGEHDRDHLERDRINRNSQSVKLRWTFDLAMCKSASQSKGGGEEYLANCRVVARFAPGKNKEAVRRRIGNLSGTTGPTLFVLG